MGGAAKINSDTAADINIGNDLVMGNDSSVVAGTNANLTVNNNMTMNNNAKVNAVDTANVTVTNTLLMNDASSIDPVNVNLLVNDLIMNGTSNILASNDINATVRNDMTMNDSSLIDAGHDALLKIGTTGTGNLTMNDSSKISAGNDIKASVKNDMTMNGSSMMNALHDVILGVDHNLTMNDGSSITAGNNADLDIDDYMYMNGTSAISAVQNVDINVVNDDLTMTGNSSINAGNDVIIYTDDDMIMSDAANIHADNNVNLTVGMADFDSDNNLNMSGSSSITAGNNIDVYAERDVNMSGTSNIYASNNTVIEADDDMTMNDSSKVGADNDTTIDIADDLTMNGASSIDPNDVNITVGSDMTMNGTSNVLAENNTNINVGNNLTMNDASRITAANNANIDVANVMTMNDSSAIDAKAVTVTTGSDFLMNDLSTIGHAGTADTVNITSHGIARVSDDGAGIRSNDVVNIQADGNIELGVINSTNNINLISHNGDILDTSNDNDVNLTTKNLLMDAFGTIGTVSVGSLGDLLDIDGLPYDGMINTDVENMTATARNGDIFVREANDINVNNSWALGSIIGIIAGGTINLYDVHAIGSGLCGVAALSLGGSVTADLVTAVSSNYIAAVVLLADNMINAINSSAQGDELAAVVLGSLNGAITADNLSATANDYAVIAMGSVDGGVTANNILAQADDLAAVIIGSINGDINTGNIVATATNIASIIALGTVNGNIYMGNLSADIVAALALGLDGDGSIYDAAGVVTADYLAMIARNDIGTNLNPITTNVENLAAYSYFAGNIFVDNTGDLLNVGIYYADIPFLGNIDLGMSVAANNGIISVTNTGDMVVNSVISPRGGVYLESEDGSIYAGQGWLPNLSTADVTSINSSLSGLLGGFPVDITPGLMDVTTLPLEWGSQTDYFTPIMIGDPLLPGPNVIAGGYSMFVAQNGTIGVGSPKGLPGPADDAVPATYNPLKVSIQVIQDNIGTGLNPEGVNSAVPVGVYGAGVTPPSGLTLVMGGVVDHPYNDGFNGQLGISGAIEGIVRSGVPANFYTEAVTPVVLSSPGYVFYDDTEAPGVDAFAGYLPATYSAPIGDYDILRQIYPPIPSAPVFNLGNLLGILGQELRFRIPGKNTVDMSQITFTQGPSILQSNTTQLFFYHPLTEMNMYEVPSLGLDMYEFIDGNINAVNPALLPIQANLDEEEENKQV